jgi:hypothetical protein
MTDLDGPVAVNRKDGGPAFPCNGEMGMSLRDYFAAQVIIALSGNVEFSAFDIAEQAYLIADAMLEERDNEN